MSGPKMPRPNTEIFADHEVIRPPNRLAAKAVRKISVAMPGDDPVDRAEKALHQISSEFAAWMNAECERLDAARHTVKQDGFDKRTMEELFHAAHDIKGGAATFGYPVVAPAADSLCRVLEHSPDPARIPMELVDQHVDAIRAIVREYARHDCEIVAHVLTKRLREVSNEFLTRANAHRPEYLAGIDGPPLVPDEGA